jgi:hypothetical protein
MNEVKINLNMLGALMLDEIGGEIDCADIVPEHQVGHGAVLYLSIRTRDNVQPFQGPRYEVVA